MKLKQLLFKKWISEDLKTPMKYKFFR